MLCRALRPAFLLGSDRGMLGPSFLLDGFQLPGLTTSELWPQIHRAVSASRSIHRKISRGYCVQNDHTFVGPALVPHTGL